MGPTLVRIRDYSDFLTGSISITVQYGFGVHLFLGGETCQSGVGNFQGDNSVSGLSLCLSLVVSPRHGPGLYSIR